MLELARETVRGVPCAACAIDRLCARCCDDAFMQLRGVVACRGEVWACELARRRRQPWVPWPVDSARVHAAALDRCADLTGDAALRRRLATELERWAAKRWNAGKT